MWLLLFVAANIHDRLRHAIDIFRAARILSLDLDSRCAHSAAMDIKATREAMGLSAVEFAEKLGVAPSTVYRLEEGKFKLTKRMASHIRAVAKTKVVE
jgi:DNA-binding transcriptional regulator YiaG